MKGDGAEEVLTRARHVEHAQTAKAEADGRASRGVDMAEALEDAQARGEPVAQLRPVGETRVHIQAHVRPPLGAPARPNTSQAKPT